MNRQNPGCLGEGSAFEPKKLGDLVSSEEVTRYINCIQGRIGPIRLKTTIVPKGWGHETHICNNDEFCGKELHINAGHQFSMHFHIKKREVFRLRSGKVFLDTIDLTNADHKGMLLEPGDIVEIPRHLPHSIKAIEDSIIDEYSTTHEDADSYRVLPGSSQKKV